MAYTIQKSQGNERQTKRILPKRQTEGDWKPDK